MKLAYLITYLNETLAEVRPVQVRDGYDGRDSYGDDVPFAVGSNQKVVLPEDLTEQARLKLKLTPWTKCARVSL